jgi:hypothetical protein
MQRGGDPSRNLIRAYPFIVGWSELADTNMRSFLADGDPSAPFGSRSWNSDFPDQPEIAVLYAITGWLMELLGPIFWAALIVLFVQAELLTRTALITPGF